jgi:hypothetical protein
MDSKVNVKRTPQIEDQIIQLGNAIERALSLKEDFESRLSCILINEEPQNGSLEKAKEPTTLVPLATILDEFNMKLSILNNSLDSILNRIEL